MPRNGSGTMTIANSFSSGTTIASASVNANFTDVASEITGSLPRNGEAAMTGQLKAANGTASAPAFSFGSDPDTGFYRSGSGAIGVAADGASVAVFDTTGLTVDGVTLDNTGLHVLDTDGSHDLIIKPGSNLTADRTLTVTTGDADRAVTLSGDLTVSAASTLSGNVTVASGKTATINNTVTLSGTDGTTMTLPGSTTTLYGQADNATQSDQETGTSTTKVVTPGTQRHHPLSPKAWFYATLSGTTITVQAHFGITSVVRSTTGKMTVTMSTAMSSANYCVVCSVTGDGAGTDVNNTCQDYNKGTTTFEILVQNGATFVDGWVGMNCIVMGDQ